MDKEMLEALQASIAKWESYLLATEETLPNIYHELGTDSCPLCKLQCKLQDKKPENLRSCGNCVVAVAGHRGCGGTPYEKAEDYAVEGYLEGFLKEASREVDFLKSLLPQT